MFGLDAWLTCLLIFCLLCAFAFEFINGFHDTANAVATVIYTNSLRPSTAVVISALFNSVGVLVGGLSVAMAIVSLLPVEAVTDANTWHSASLVLALLITAIGWNLGTWYFGIPCSSSHTLIGSIIGVGLAYSYIGGEFGKGINWSKAQDIGMSLLLSPAIGFFLSVILMLILRYTVKNKTIFKEPQPGKKPPMWIRTILIGTSIGVSWTHGSNDGQKGVGLVMLVLIGIVPMYFAIDRGIEPKAVLEPLAKIELAVNDISKQQLEKGDREKIDKAIAEIADLKLLLQTNGTEIPREKAFEVRKDVLLIASNIDKVLKGGHVKISDKDKKELTAAINGEEGSFFIPNDQVIGLKSFTNYAPTWVIIMISLALGLGTMVGWKRIVITIGEKIGNTNLNYAQGASAQLVAMSTIAFSTYAGLPVSTTQVLTGGVTGAMASAGGIKNLQGGTLKNIFIAWVLTLPVTVVLSASLFLLLRAFGG
jgi:phosphate/sulfate permease